jgi:hypothetical protein
VTRAELAAQINHLQDIKAMKAARQLQESQKKAEEDAKREADEEAKRVEKAKKASENETRNQIAAEVGSSRYEVEMLEKLKAKAVKWLHESCRNLSKINTLAKNT